MAESKSETDRIVGWPKGVNNRAPDHALPEGALRQGINVDVLSDGRVRRREGFESVLAGNYQSLHGADNDRFGLVLKDGVLQRLTHNGTTLATEVVATGLLTSKHMSYAYVNGKLYYSNGTDSGKVGETGAAERWTVEAPSVRPTVEEAAGGLLMPGQYQVTLTYVTAAMEESAGLNAPIAVTVTGSNYALRLSNISQPTTAEVTAVRVYASRENGTILFRVADLPLGTTTYLIQSVPGDGRAFRAGTLGPLPAGSPIAYYNGRLYSAVGNVLWESEPFNYGLCNLSENFTLFPAEITLIAPALDGVYVASDSTYFLAGPSVKKAESMRAVLPYGAVKYAVTKRRDTDVPVWLSHRGFVEGGDGGRVKNLQEEHVAIPEHEEGALLFREQNGIKQIIGLGSGGYRGHVSDLAATDFANAEVRRAGVVGQGGDVDGVVASDLAEATVIRDGLTLP